MTLKLLYFFKSPRRKNYHKYMVESEILDKKLKRNGYLDEVDNKRGLGEKK